MDQRTTAATPGIENLPPPLIAHVIYRLDVGGLENGVVNLVNRLPAERFRHAIVCLTDYTEFRDRVERPEVEVYAVHKREGHDLGAAWRLYRLFRALRPDIVHTRNLGCLEAVVPARLAGVPVRIHGEHGWDVFDPGGDNRKYQWLRRVHSPWVDRFVPLSRELESYLVDRVGIRRDKVTRVYNGVDTTRFRSATKIDAGLPPSFTADDLIVIGTVGRMHGVKDQVNLAAAFVRLCRMLPEQADKLRLVMLGDGPLRDTCLALLRDAGLTEQAWLPGSRDDVPALMHQLDVFVLPSQAEGISNTILEAMATGLPVVATAVGGNLELVLDGETGTLVPPSDPDTLAKALAGYASDMARRSAHGTAGRQRAEQLFSLSGMMARYTELYDSVLRRKLPSRWAAVPEP